MLRRIMKWLTGFPEEKRPAAASSSKERSRFSPQRLLSPDPDCRPGCGDFLLAQPVRQKCRRKSHPGAEPDHGPAENRSQDGSTPESSPPGGTETGSGVEQTAGRSPAPAVSASRPRSHWSQSKGPDPTHDPAEGEIGAVAAQPVAGHTIFLQLFPDYNTIEITELSHFEMRCFFV